MTHHLLIVEDDQALNQMLALHFEDEGYSVEGVHSCRDALARLDAGRVDLLLLDQQLPDGKGTDLLRAVLGRDPGLPVIMMTGEHDLELAIDAIKQGAADFVHKPVKAGELQQTIERLLRNRMLSQRTGGTSGEAAPTLQRDLIGKSHAMLRVSKEIALCARSSATVLITGESGTGKEVAARLIHQHSGREGPFVAVNCAAIVDTLLESELFGHEKGAFTGAQARKLGKFELASAGTLFLDEVGELAVQLQAKLLRALQERLFERVGGVEPIKTGARVVAATNRDLLEEARAGRFREDLVYRLNVFQIQMPPLRDRREDIPLLIHGLLARIAERVDRPLPRVTTSALDRLCAYGWPGNVRELENMLTQATVRARDALITPELVEMGMPDSERAPSLPAEGIGGSGTAALRTLDQLEAEHVQRVLDHTGGHKGRTSEILGISRPALDRKIAKYRLRLPER